MNVETKTVDGDYSEYLKFGWEFAEDTRVRFGRVYRTGHVLVRDKDRPNYRLIAALEMKYFTLKDKKKTYLPMDGLLSFALFLLFIIPFVIYWAVKSAEKDRIEENNRKIQKEMDAVLTEVAPLL